MIPATTFPVTQLGQESFSVFAETILRNKGYIHYKKEGGRYNGDAPRESWAEAADRVASSVTQAYLPSITPRVRDLISSRRFLPAGRYLYAAGRKYHQVNNCFMFSAEDSREGWAELLSNATNALMTGGGIGVVYSKLRPEGCHIQGLGGTSTGPIALMQMVNEAARYIIQGGSRRSAVWAGLHWSHPDVFKFITLKEWSGDVKALKAKDYTFPAPMDGTNISVILDDEFFLAYEDPTYSRTIRYGTSTYTVTHKTAVSIYSLAVESMLRTGEPGFSIDTGENGGEHLRNACTEATSRDDCDMCNLASLNMARFNSVEEFEEGVEAGVAFLLCGTLYSKLPVEKMYKVREKNRRLGLGVMGVHEWMLKRGFRYGSCEAKDALRPWMEAYERATTHANFYADKLGIAHPVATRSIAPTGTISIIAETTSGIEPIFATAFKRRYLEGKIWKYQYVIDSTAKRLIDEGTPPELVEDSMILAEDTSRRIDFQSYLQQYVDQGISSTINLPEWGSPLNNPDRVSTFSKALYRRLPTLRGITAYPNGARDGQPLVRIPYEEALDMDGRIFEDNSGISCRLGDGVCGS